MSTVKKIGAKHLADLRASGLSDETVRLSGIYTETNPECISKLLGWSHPASGVGDAMVIPFADVDGKPTTFHRLKLDRPVIGKDGKPRKYESRKGGGTAIYMPPLARKYAKDVSVPLVVGEGEKKALKADQEGFACVGLGGCWNWTDPAAPLGPNGTKPLHADFGGFTLKGRTVIVAFDSDIVYKPDVKHAEWQLARSLIEAGAEVRVVRLPQRIGGAKVGLDDYLVAHSANELQSLIDRAAPPAPPPARFSNVVWKKTDPKKEPVAIPRALEEAAVELAGYSGGWPRVVADSLVVPSAAGGGVWHLKDHHDLFAYLARVYDENGVGGVEWHRAGPSQPVFYRYLTAHCQRFARVDPLPHVPPLPGVLYLNPTPKPDGKFEAIQKFLSFFSPATDDDAALLLAALLTTFWGGPAGKRPAFLFEAEEDDPHAGRGVGKSTVATKIAALSGGAFGVNPAEPFTKTQTRLLTPAAGAFRVLLMDNVKSFRLSSPDLESLVTSPFVDGHKMWCGQSSVPNFFTLFITLNGASLSKDFAQRTIPVRLTRAKYSGGWEAALDKYVAANKDRLIADIVGMLKSPPARPKGATRWGQWEAEVLARVGDPDRLMKVIRERTDEMDGDADDGARIREMWVMICQRSLDCPDPHSKQFLLRSSATTKLIELALNDRHGANAASGRMASLMPKGFRKSDRGKKGLGRMWLWTGDCATDGGKKPIVEYDREREEWSVADSEFTEPKRYPVNRLTSVRYGCG